MNIDSINPEEYLSRFLFSNSHFSKENQRVKYGAFLPAKNGETSVFRTSNLSDNQIWDLGERNVAQERKKPLLGRGDIRSSMVFESGLKIRPDNNPPRHANIIGWPEEKSKQKLIAIELAANATFHLK